jgi:uncharacterized membrane protein YdjX (TVP38/TMEM64 family)
MQKKRIVIAVAAILIIIGLYYGGLKDWVSLEGLKGKSEYFKIMVDRNYWFSAGIFMAAYTLAMTASIPIVAPLSLLGGFLFNTIPGACFSAFGAAIGSVVYVVLFRQFFAASMYEQFEPQLIRFKENVKVYGKSYVLILHFMTVIPFFMINTLSALADLSLTDVFWTTIVGSGPLFLLFSYEGRQLAHIESISDIFSPQFILALGLLVVLACMPMIIKRIRGSFNI